jgi:acyl carrier protein
VTEIEVLERLQPIFRDVLGLPHLVVTRESNASNTEDWDSLAQINLVSSMEHEFKIRFALGELQELKNVGDMVDLVAKKTGTR